MDCTPGGGATPDPIRMTAADAQYAKQWSAGHGLTLDMVFNGGGSEDYKAEHGGADPTADQLIADKSAFRWVNHTYQHPFLGCVQDVSVVPWKCSTDASGKIQWVSQADITSQITQNRTWAGGKGLALDNTELVTGEHSGMKVLPQQPDDNPNLAPSLNATGVKWLASDNSRDPQQRQIGSALTAPRFPMNVYYNAGHATEEVDEYNFVYTSRANGGSGICEGSSTTTCLSAPLDPQTGYTSYIVPLESRIALGHALSNDPRPVYMHQSNLAEDRIAYPVLDKILGDYTSLYAANTPLVNLRMKDIGTELKYRAAWAAAVKNNQVTAYRIGNTVTISSPNGTQTSATMPAGTTQKQLIGSTAFGAAYAGQLSGWTTPGTLQTSITLQLTTQATPAAPTGTGTGTGTAKVAAPAPALRVPSGVASPVPAGPGDTARRKR
ncbi:hypothetical protein SAV31267_095660 [Streptomyces avermitilis]|uniref:Secreted protein n=1 Tax=Streptomyces avermitilis TaxID=33903 RepID=A0A4D4N6A1_STRAX|nr:hypothetical protein SAV31267_095660 [Streptomyces avermitilis]